MGLRDEIYVRCINVYNLKVIESRNTTKEQDTKEIIPSPNKSSYYKLKIYKL